MKVNEDHKRKFGIRFPSYHSIHHQPHWNLAETNDLLPPPEVPFNAIRSPSLPAMARKSKFDSLKFSDSVPNMIPNTLKPRIVLTKIDSEDNESFKSRSSKNVNPGSRSSRISPSPYGSNLSCASQKSDLKLSQNKLWDESLKTLDSPQDHLKFRGKHSLPDDGEFEKIKVLPKFNFSVFEMSPYIPAHLSSLSSSRNHSLTANVGSQTHLNTSLSYLNMKETNKFAKRRSSNMSLRSPSERDNISRSTRGVGINTREKALISGVLNRWTSN